jgi:Methyltransferase domain
MKEYIQFGCGLCAPPGWRNFDVSPTLRLQRLPLIGSRLHGKNLPFFPVNAEYGDIVQGLPVPVNSCRAVYSSHVLEHLALDDLRTSLKNIYSYLQDGGVFRFVVPDLEILARTYLTSPEPDASLVFMEQGCLGKRTRPRTLRALVRDRVGNSSHLWMWDFKSMSAELRTVGFRRIRRAELGDSADPRFADVEEADRWKDCLGMECVR